LCLANDYLEIFFEALEKKHYKCFLGPKSTLPMVYIDDCIEGTVSWEITKKIGQIFEGRLIKAEEKSVQPCWH
jgi:hypothetical protein